ncbi:anion-transporting ArsA/GET3 family ATPase [Paraburkholderia graminis]|uniref:arsenite-transporting ATPase n=1 Tax=Paraburkholderia graminis TaxID=60548 RepID=A0ABD5CA76_9BURK|nr:anion-transporting ArsA/GET3 family ATPase [Paraburkholderia graminis]
MTLPLVTTRHLFFTGKGGVGKTSLACATALQLAENGKAVLLVSTDPASNLDEVLETQLSGQPTPVAQVPYLHALNIDPGTRCGDLPRAYGQPLSRRVARCGNSQHGGTVFRWVHRVRAE